MSRPRNGSGARRAARGRRSWPRRVGIALALSAFVGGFATAGWVVRLDYGIALASDLDELEGDQEILLQFLRIY